jgi:hypothetical protein
MFKKIIINLITITVVCFLLIATFLMRKETNLIKSLLNINNKTKLLQEKLDNPSYTDPDLNDFVIQNVLAVKRTVYLLQWEEVITGNKAEYRAIWSSNFINSDKFIDKTKVNYNHGERYKSLEIIYISEQLKKLMINEEQMAKKISYEKPNLFELHINKTFDAKEEKTIVQNSPDFASDLDEYVFSNQKVNKDIFKLINNNTLVNGIDLIKPQIGDIKIEYQIFSPDYIIAFVNTSNKHNHAENFIFTETMYNFADSKFIKFIVFTVFILYSNIIFSAWLFVVNNLKKYSKNFVLNFVYLINEYLIFGSSCHFALFMTFISIFFVINIYAFILFILVFACALNRDYFSI